MTHIVLLVIVAASIVLMLVRPRDIAEVWWVGTGACLLVLLRLVPLKLAGKAIAEGSDIYLFLIGMMLLSELARENGVFDWLAGLTVRGANHSPTRLFTLVYLVGTAVTIAMSNDATAVVLTPAILTAVGHAKAKPKPYLFACAMIANAASFVLPISNPANLVVFHAGLPSLGRWIAAFALPSVASIAVTYVVLRMYFRKDLSEPVECPDEEHALTANGKLVLAGLGLVVITLLITSALKHDLGLPTCVAALLITTAVCVKRRESPLPLAREISWSTLALVAALFVLVHGVETVGALDVTTQALRYVQHLPAAGAAFLTSAVVAVANNLVNNLPLGLIAGSTLQAAHLTHGTLVNATLIGVDLGPNLSVTGSLATILWLLALRRGKVEVSAWDFLKAGALAMPLALVAATAALLISPGR